jgi:tight adherence protein C
MQPASASFFGIDVAWAATLLSGIAAAAVFVAI